MSEGRWRARRTHDVREIKALLGSDPAYAAFPLGYLDARNRPDAEWALATLDGEPKAVACLYHGLKPPAAFTVGEGAGLALIFGAVLRAPLAHFSLAEEHLPVVRSYYALGHPIPMVRMTASATGFRPVAGAAERLTERDLEDLGALYRLGDAELFSPEQWVEGVFYGVRVMGMLVAAAGTHLVSQECGVAVVGSVFTDPGYRRRGLGSLVTSQVTAELLKRGLLVVLNVRQDNPTAQRIYRALGYREHCRYVEALGRRRTAR
ncbi:MAG: GNAT family N-acetyltransferase [Chloroflexi bacterium]|nr:GNAT family N-acetyltransferase [Chloroflexota bacterium]